jgi:hypothetical protein
VDLGIGCKGEVVMGGEGHVFSAGRLVVVPLRGSHSSVTDRALDFVVLLEQTPLFQMANDTFRVPSAECVLCLRQLARIGKLVRPCHRRSGIWKEELGPSRVIPPYLPVAFVVLGYFGRVRIYNPSSSNNVQVVCSASL